MSTGGKQIKHNTKNAWDSPLSNNFYVLSLLKRGTIDINTIIRNVDSVTE